MTNLNKQRDEGDSPGSGFLQSIKRVGIIAGEGALPALVAEDARSRGIEPVTVTFSTQTRKILEPLSSALIHCGIGQTGKIVKFLKNEEVRDLVFVGKVDKRLMYRNPILDFRAIQFLRRLKDRRDDSLMLAIIKEFESEGFQVLPQKKFLSKLFPGVGVLSQRLPTQREREDLEFGFRMAKGIAALDLGQTVVVRDQAVVAVETIEGTDETIQRGCRISEGKAVAVKVAKPRQDPRFDVPVVGENTLIALKDGRGTALGIEAEQTMILSIRPFLEAANRWKIAVVAVDPEREEEASD